MLPGPCQHLTVPTCPDVVVDASHHNGGIGNGLSLLVCHHTLDSPVGLGEEKR